MQRFPEKLRTLREGRGLTKQKLAHALGFSDAHIHYLETGKRKPSAEFVYKLAQFFGVTTDALLNDALEVDTLE